MSRSKSKKRPVKRMQKIRRGDIFFVEKSESDTDVVGSEQEKGRPAVVVSNDANNKFSKVVEVVYLTTSKTKNELPTHVPVFCTRQSLALCEQVSSVSILRLGERFGQCTEREMRQIDHALKVSLGLIPPSEF